MENIVDYLISTGYLKTPLITEAFSKIKRIDFLPLYLKKMADFDEALPIGEGQTISQPAVVAFMLELLSPKPGEKVLDIGSGSGWTSALLSYIVSKGGKNKKGRVLAIEIKEKLKNFGVKNTAKYSFVKRGIIRFVCGDGKKDLEKEEVFDRILVSAAAEEVPQELKNHLKIGGRLVIPIMDKKERLSFQQSIWLFEKKEKNRFKTKRYPGFIFVPLIKK
jgi:protein-L-isoaspartate(D-aspartate) O-methyltransferase